MSEYWVSTAKHYCKVCNTWIADNKVNRQNHDNSVKHKTNVAMQDKKRAEQKLFGLRDERELKRQLDEINKAALEAVQADRNEVSGYIHTSSSSTGINKPKSNPNPPVSQGVSHSETIKDIDKDGKNGFYTVNGQGYLQGEYNEHLLVANSTCQIFIEEKEEWMDAIIVSRIDKFVPNTDLTIKSFVVDHKIDEPPGWTRTEGVRSDKLRLLATADGLPTELDGTPIQSMSSSNLKVGNKKVIEKTLPKNESTGISGWHTVSVTLIDEEEVRRQRELDEAKEREDGENDKLLSHTYNDDDIFHERNIELSRKVYKGVPISQPATIDAGNNILSDGRTIEFKKRKIGHDINEDDNHIVVKVENEKHNIKVENSVKNTTRNIRKRHNDEDDV